LDGERKQDTEEKIKELETKGVNTRRMRRGRKKERVKEGGGVVV
jgi:hypothetical protein